MEIRPEQPADYAAVYDVVASAFGQDAEARLVDALRKTASPTISLVAVVGNRIVGHIFFSPVTVGGASAIGLAPVAVVPELQRDGIGKALMHAGLRACEEIGEHVVFVLGHRAYYPRFGFHPADDYGCYFGKPGPNPSFMVAELRDGAIGGRSGEVRYAPEFYEM